jgi:hypothetical protein
MVKNNLFPFTNNDSGTLFVKKLDESVVRFIFQWLTGPDVFILSSVNRFFHELLHSGNNNNSFGNRFWKSRVFCKHGPSSELSTVAVSKLSPELCAGDSDWLVKCVLQVSRLNPTRITKVQSAHWKAMQLDALISDWKLFFKNLYDLACGETIMPLRHVTALDASSTDHESQSIQETMISDIYNSFWSSKGSAPDSDEHLTYQLTDHGYCVVSRVLLVPYCAYYQPGTPTYGSQKVQIVLSLDHEFKHITYTSDIMEIENTNEVHELSFSSYLAFGKFARIYLYGKVQLQQADNLFYSCLALVQFEGLHWSQVYSRSPIFSSLFNVELGAVDEYVNESSSKMNQMVYRLKHCPSFEQFTHAFVDTNIIQDLELRVQFVHMVLEKFTHVAFNCGHPAVFFLMELVAKGIQLTQFETAVLSTFSFLS